MALELGKIIHNFAHACGVSTYIARRMNVMRIMMFHGVGDAECPEHFFIQQLRYLTQHFEVVSMDVILERLASRKNGSGREVALTFDDGLRNNFTTAYPLLQKFGIPATFFICPGLIEEGRWLWNHEARQRLLGLQESERAEVSAAFGHNMKSVEQIISWMKRIPREERVKVEARIREMTLTYKPTVGERNCFDIMTWKDIAAMPRELITIGAHTSSHAILDSLDEGELTEEIEGCRSQLEAKLQRPVEYFCYPNGIHPPAAVRKVRDTFRAGVTTEPGIVQPGDDPIVLKRITVAPDIPYFAWRMCRPAS